MEGPFNLLTPADKLDVVYLELVSFDVSDSMKPKATFAIRVLSISSKGSMHIH